MTADFPREGPGSRVVELELGERLRAERRERVPRAARARTYAGLTVKQGLLLDALVTVGGDGLVAREFEAVIARAVFDAGVPVIGWAASDCTTTLHRLCKRGLVTWARESGVSYPRLRWWITSAGVAAHRDFVREREQ